MRQRPSTRHTSTGELAPACSCRCKERIDQWRAFNVGILGDRMRMKDSVTVRLLGIIATLIVDLHSMVVVIMQRAGMVIEGDGMQSADMTAIARMRVTGRSRGHAETREGQRKTS